MTLTINLHETQENDIRALADAHGVTFEEEARVLLRCAVQREKNKKVLALLDRWKAEDAQMTQVRIQSYFSELCKRIIQLMETYSVAISVVYLDATPLGLISQAVGSSPIADGCHDWSTLCLAGAFG